MTVPTLNKQEFGELFPNVPLKPSVKGRKGLLTSSPFPFPFAATLMQRAYIILKLLQLGAVLPIISYLSHDNM
jgi:hypothetical protein